MGAKPTRPRRDRRVLIFRPYYTTKDGRRVYAKWYGLKSWPLWVPVTK